MTDKYIPPYEITDEMLELVSEIMENLGKLSGVNELENRTYKWRQIKSSFLLDINYWFVLFLSIF